MLPKVQRGAAGVGGQVPVLQRAWQELCIDNKYETTLHVIASAITKLGKVETADTLFRAPGGALPHVTACNGCNPLHPLHPLHLSRRRASPAVPARE